MAAINNAKDHDAAVDATAEYQSKIDEIDVPGEELPAPNYNKDNLTNGRNEGTTIDNGSTVIGHGSGEATATNPTQPALKKDQLQQHLQHNLLQLQKGLQVLEMPHQFKQEQEG